MQQNRVKKILREGGLALGHATSTSPMPTVERDISIGEAGDVSIGDLHKMFLTDREVTISHR
jgi:hypothetical protein